MLATHPDAILVCPSCGRADVDFEIKSDRLVRCSLCSAFVELDEGIDFPKDDERPAPVLEIRGHVYSPARRQSQKRGRAV